MITISTGIALYLCAKAGIKEDDVSGTLMFAAMLDLLIAMIIIGFIFTGE